VNGIANRAGQDTYYLTEARRIASYPDTLQETADGVSPFIRNPDFPAASLREEPNLTHS
jgi:hypothetical protein